MSSESRALPVSRIVDEKHYPHEWRVIGFLYARDGVTGALDYCTRTSRTYRTAVLTSRKRGHTRPHFASLPEYRSRFIRAYLDFKRFGLNHRKASAGQSVVMPGHESSGG